MKKEFEVKSYSVTYTYDGVVIDYEVFEKDKFVLSGLYSPASDYISFENERQVMVWTNGM